MTSTNDEREASPQALEILKQIDDAYAAHMGDPDGDDTSAAKNAAALIIDGLLTPAAGEAVALKWNEAAAAVTEGLTGDAFVLTRSEGLWTVRTLDAWRHLNAAPQSPATGGDAVDMVARAIYLAMHGDKGGRWECVEPRYQEQVWGAYAKAAIAALANHSPDAGGVGEVLIEVQRDNAGDAMICTGCGSVETLASIKRRKPTAFSCCPERKMVVAVAASDEPGRPGLRGEE